MRPWQHAASSAGSAGRPWDDDLDIHEFLDMTKACCADRRHRLALHSVDLGAELAARAFPDRPDARAVAVRHVVEDLGRPATVADWLAGCDPRRLPLPLHRRLLAGKAGVVELVVNRLDPSCRPAVSEVYDLLTLPVALVPRMPELGYSVLMNAFGPALVRRLLGRPRVLAHERGKIMLDYAWIAEALAFAMFGRIPDLGEVARACVREPFADQAQMERSHGDRAYGIP